MMKEKNERIIFCFWGISLLVILIYRVILINDYVIKYVDEDQALLWYGTAHIANFHFPEPHFFGQAYGSMLESVVAVPLYWAGVPLNISLPVATLILWFSPFVILSIIQLKRKEFVGAYSSILLTLLFNWDYDLLTSISRSFIPGFLFAFIGILLWEKNKGCICAFFSWIMFALAYICTETTITVVALCILNSLLNINYKEISIKKKYMICNISGVGIAGILVYYCNIFFYKRNPEYNLHVPPKFELSIEAFESNLNHLKILLKSFSVLNISGIPVVMILLVLLLLLYACYVKAYRNILLIVCSILGSCSFLFLTKSLDYRESLLFSQTRMFLFVPYVLLFLIYHCVNTKICDTKMFIIISMMFAVLGIYKIDYFKQYALKKQELYSNEFINIIDVEKVYCKAEEIRNISDINNIDTVIFIDDDRTLGYATSAINYDKYIGYNAFYDRRTFVYDYLRYTNYDKEVLLVEVENDINLNMHTEDMCGMCPVYWILNNYGIQRYPKDSKFYQVFDK